MTPFRCVVLMFLALVSSWTVSPVAAQTMPHAADGSAAMPDDWLFASKGPAWWYQMKPSTQVKMLDTRNATKAEQQVIDKANNMMSQYPIKAIALIDGDKVVYSDYNAPAGPMSTIYGASMGKTITGIMVGQAICAGKLKMETKADELIPELKGKQLGATTVRDLLRMSSGTKHENADGNMFTPAQVPLWDRGQVNLLDVIQEDRNSTVERGVFSDYKPGEAFSYKNSNPAALGMMIRRATGMTYAEWFQSTIAEPMGAAEMGLVVQDKQGEGLAEGGVRMKMEDWVRFAVWVRKATKEKSCFGDYMRQATKTQIANGPAKGQRKSGALFAGYGYLTWTDNEVAPDSFWASGYGGQRIGWFNDSDRIIIVFSSVENWMAQLYALGKAWDNAR